ncbi:MAG TPA: anhydro-N-acetylmuramic acid kinase [Candidatus Dormibacteraeota bacterium]|nr:anhydro-N-acetylmuramic acid kinase [Candidatus Dormibacteraeota bacterium]
MRVIGLISGTSFDAIEVAAADFELEGDILRCTLLGAESRPYAPPLRDRIAAALPPAATTLAGTCELDTLIGQAFAEAAAAADQSLCHGRAELVCSHGQTVYHWVSEGRALGTLQLGQAAWIAERTGLPVVSNVRARDLTVGGQGAPLVSILDTLLLAETDGTAGAAALNLGGIANLTAVRPGQPPIAYDTGPANALIDAAVREVTGGAEHYDDGGRRAARGQVDRRLLDRLLDEPYYRQAPPKTTGKELFHLPYLRARTRGFALAADDLVATVTALTVETVARELRQLGVEEVYVSGGGSRNATLMGWLEVSLPAVRLRSSADLGVPEASKEALAFALIGFLTAVGLPSTVPSCTGGSRPVVLGSLTPGRSPMRLPEPAATAPRRLRLEGPR